MVSPGRASGSFFIAAGTSSALRDERFDTAFVTAEIAKRDVEHSGKQRSADDAKENTDETPQRHVKSRVEGALRCRMVRP
jgi:hypothetical protein